MSDNKRPSAIPHGSLKITTSTTLLGCDQQNSIVRTLTPIEKTVTTYSAYGYSGRVNLLAFNGELKHKLTGHYSLGNGHRQFNPFLMRFNTPDFQSPFREGGINCYAYCLDDPINYQDPSGNTAITTTMTVLRAVGRFKKSILPKKSSPSQWKPLKNRTLSNLSEEIHETTKLMKKNRFRLRLVNSESDLSKVKDDSLRHKFIFTEDKKFVMGSSKFVMDEVSHGSIAELGKQNLGSGDVISAGYIFKENGQFHINHHSGHYRPEFERLEVVREHLKNFGINVTSVRIK